MVLVDWMLETSIQLADGPLGCWTGSIPGVSIRTLWKLDRTRSYARNRAHST